jgi:excisionase family DNA binding protein
MEAMITKVPEMLTVKELSKTLEIGLPLAYNLVRRKGFPSIKLGREYRVFASELPAWMEKQKRYK